MIETLNTIDGQVLLFFNQFHCPTMDVFMMLFTGRWVWVPMYAALLLLLFRVFPWQRVVAFGLGIAVAITLADQTCATVLRPIFERLRPANLDNPISSFVHIVDGYRGGKYGFPSCHAANTFALASFMSLVVRRRRFVAYIFTWAVVVSYSRIYLGVHYPGDLLFGSVVGMAAGTICYFAVRGVMGPEPPEVEIHKGEKLQLLSVGVSKLAVSNLDLGLFVGVLTAVALFSISMLS